MVLLRLHRQAEVVQWPQIGPRGIRLVATVALPAVQQNAFDLVRLKPLHVAMRRFLGSQHQGLGNVGITLYNNVMNQPRLGIVNIPTIYGDD